jgi:hypothetical protein
MKQSALRRLVADRRGSSSVEFLFGVLFVAILLIGFLEMGRAIHYYQVLTDGARSGGRYLTRVENPCTPAAIKDALGLVITRSADWAQSDASRVPIFSDWPTEDAFPESLGSGDYGYKFEFDGAANFVVEVEGCEAGTFHADNDAGLVILKVGYGYQDYLGLLAFLGLEDGFLIVGRHEERHIGT